MNLSPITYKQQHDAYTHELSEHFHVNKDTTNRTVSHAEAEIEIDSALISGRNALT